MSEILISIIIPNKNGASFIEKCLKCLLKERGAGYEIIICDDASSDNSLQIINEYLSIYPQIRLIKQKKSSGAAKARNIAVQKSRGEYLFFIDNDTEVAKGWLTKIPKLFLSHPKAGIAQVKLLKMGTNIFDYAGDYFGPFGFLIERAEGAIDRNQHDITTHIFAGKSAGMIIRKNVYLKVGGFDNDYLYLVEDTDLCWRMWLLGYQVYYYPQVTVWHAFNSPYKSLNHYRSYSMGIYYLACRNMLITHFKNLGLFRLLFIFPLQIFIWSSIALVFMLKGKYSQVKQIGAAILWIFNNRAHIISKRKYIQAMRMVSDDEIFKLVGANKPLNYYFRKLFDYSTNTV